MVIAIICSIALGFIVGGIVFSIICSRDPYPFDLSDFERERRIRAENDACKLYREIENMRRDQIYRASYPLYQIKEPLLLEIQKFPRVESMSEAKEKYGEHYGVTDAIIGKLNEVIDEVNHPRIKKV